MQEQPVDTARLQTLARAYCHSAILFSAVDIDLFTAVARGNDSEAKLALALDLSLLDTERMVTACLALGLLAWDGEHLANAPDVQRYLVRGEKNYAGPWMHFTRPDVESWFSLTERLRSKEPLNILGAVADLTVEDARRYHEATYSIGMGSGRRFARQVDLSGRRLLLDIGGGSGAYSIRAVQANPELRAVVFDLPPVVVVTREFLARNGVEDRVSAVGGDFTSDPFPEGVDAAVMASNLVMYGEDVIQSVIGKAFAALVPGGEMHAPVPRLLRKGRLRRHLRPRVRPRPPPSRLRHETGVSPRRRHMVGSTVAAPR
jgi:hypothetical protein